MTDILCEIRFLSSEVSGRFQPVYSGYRPVHDFFGDGRVIGAQHDYVGVSAVRPGEVAVARLQLPFPEQLAASLYPGFGFTVQDGARIVAYGCVIDVLNPLLRRKTTP